MDRIRHPIAPRRQPDGSDASVVETVLAGFVLLVILVVCLGM